MGITLTMLLEHYESPGERLTPDGHPVVWVNADDLADMIALARAQEYQLAAANEAKEQADKASLMFADAALAAYCAALGEAVKSVEEISDEELTSLCERANAVAPKLSGVITSLRERVVQAERERDEVKSDNARLREALGKYMQGGHHPGCDHDPIMCSCGYHALQIALQIQTKGESNAGEAKGGEG